MKQSTTTKILALALLQTTWSVDAFVPAVSVRPKVVAFSSFGVGPEEEDPELPQTDLSESFGGIPPAGPQSPSSSMTPAVGQQSEKVVRICVNK